MLGPLEVWRDGEAIALPRSRKTRMLLAYLALTGREQRRERLCELLWDVADDPRGALRWSLSKLRKVVDQKKQKVIVADRTVIGLDPASHTTDLARVKAAVASKETELGELESMEAAFRGPLLEGLELPDFDEIGSWLYAQREEARRLHLQLAQRLLDGLEADPERAVQLARRVARLEPYDEGQRLRLVRLLNAAGRRDEAQQQLDATKAMLAELGSKPSPAFYELQRSVRTPSAVAADAPLPEPAAPVRTPAVFRTSVHGHSLVGRDSEVSSVKDLLAEVLERGTMGAALISGETGIGKSRLLFELRVEALRQDVKVLACTAFEAEGRRPYGPWIDALTAALPRGTLTIALDRLAAGGDDTEGIFHAVAAKLAELPPFVLIFDDIQWLDPASAQLASFIARAFRHQPVLIAIAARSGEVPEASEVPRFLRGLRRDRVLREIELVGLDEAQTLALMETAGGDASPARAKQSGGNPLYALELARAAEGDEESLRALVRDRIEALPPEAETVLSWASVLGVVFDPTWIPKVSGMDDEAFLNGLDVLERRALLSIPDSGPNTDRLRFAHQLVHSITYAGLSDARRKLMHRRIADHMERPEVAFDALELARHASAAGEPARAADACLAAARGCLLVFARREALRLARFAARSAKELPEPSQTERAVAATCAMVSARHPSMGGRGPEVLEALAERAIDLGLGGPACEARILAAELRWDAGENEAAIRLLERAPATAEPADQARVAAARARMALRVGEDAELPEGAEGLESLEAAALLARSQGDHDTAHRRLEEALELARALGDRRSTIRLAILAVETLLDRGMVFDALQHAEELERRVERDHALRSDPIHVRGTASLVRAMLGRPGAAEALRAAIAELEELGAGPPLTALALRAAELHAQKGEADEERRLRALASQAPLA